MSHDRRDRADTLAETIRRSRVLDPEVTPRFELLTSQFHDPDGLAREMVTRQWLTSYQAEQLLEGKVDDLVLGPYILLDMLGEGGMGRVYKARHRLMNRIVALKVIRADLLALGEARQRFLREIEAAARVWHPNLITALDAAPIGDSFVLVMEYAEGATLARLLQQQGVPPIRHACDWIRQAALGLHHAHSQGLIHRDIKPSNLLLTERDHVLKVLDLGLARLDLLGEPTEGDEPITASGVVIGTPDYMSPEQAINPRAADPRSDIYSLGCTLYHLLTGRPPFPGGSLTQKLLWHQQLEPKDPNRLRASSPPGLPQIVARMMAKTPAGRFATAAEVAEHLAPYCAAAGLKTLYTQTETTGAADVAVTPSPARPLPVVHHEPSDSTTYDVVERPRTETPAEPEPDDDPPAVLIKPAVPDDDSWWREERAMARAAGSSPPAHRPDLATPPSRHAPVRSGPSLAWVLTALVLGLLVVSAFLALILG